MVKIVFSLIVLILSSSTVGYDFFQFTQQYQPAVCNSRPNSCKDPPDKLFTVHGLWPSNRTGDDPEYCNKTAINKTKINAIKTQLEIIWPNVYDRKNSVGFWERQWEKHGICGNPTIQDDMHYFQTVIKLYTIQKQNVSEILSKANIEPDGRNRTRAEIEDAIRKSTNNKKPKLKCQKNTRITELVEVTLCSDANLTRLINCPKHFPNVSRYYCPINNIRY